jgi:hypothetical protein
VAKIKIQAGKEAVEQAASFGEFEEAPPGLYTGKVKSVEFGYSKTDGKEDKDRPRLECIYTLTGVGREGAPFPEGKRYGQVWHYVSFSAASATNRAQFGLAMGLPLKNGEIDGTIETEEGKPGTVVGKELLVSIKADTDLQGNYRAKVRSVNPIGGGSEGGGDGGNVSSLFADDDDDDTGSEPDGDLEDGFDDDADGGEPAPYLTEEDLKDEDEYPDLKSLGAVAAEFDIEPRDHLVKYASGANKGKPNVAKTRAALIAAILEAQGAPDEDEAGETAPDEEDPF